MVREARVGERSGENIKQPRCPQTFRFLSPPPDIGQLLISQERISLPSFSRVRQAATEPDK